MVVVQCKTCGKSFITAPYRIKDGRGKYCSRECYVKKNRKHFKKELDPKEIVRLYVEEKTPATRIAKEFGCDYKRIYGVLRREGITRRGMSEAKKGIIAKNRYRTDLDVQALVNDYRKGMGGPEIAKKYHCSEYTILRRLKKAGVIVRTSKEGQKLFLKGDRFPSWADFMRKKMLRQYERGGFPKQLDTTPERSIKNELINRGYVEGKDFIHQFKFFDKFMCDFVFPAHKVIVECDGDFWHANPAKYAGKELKPAQKRTLRIDKSKYAYIAKADNGSWIVLRFWESDIKKDVKDCVD